MTWPWQFATIHKLSISPNALSQSKALYLSKQFPIHGQNMSAVIYNGRGKSLLYQTQMICSPLKWIHYTPRKCYTVPFLFRYLAVLYAKCTDSVMERLHCNPEHFQKAGPTGFQKTYEHVEQMFANNEHTSTLDLLYNMISWLWVIHTCIFTAALVKSPGSITVYLPICKVLVDLSRLHLCAGICFST